MTMLIQNLIAKLVEQNVFELGAKGDGATNDAAAFATNTTNKIVVGPGSGNYCFTANTTVTADLIFRGGVLYAASGVTVTLNGDIRAGHKVIFKGPGTFVVGRGNIDVAWFDGTDASSKTAFALRGVSNTNGTGKTLEYFPPMPTDAWATTSANNQWGFGWKVTAPIDLEQAQAYTVYLTHSSFIATSAMSSVFVLGSGTYKSDGQNFPLRLKIDGGNGLATWAVQSYGSSHLHLDYVEAYYCGGIALTPNGSKQCSDIRIGFLDTGALYGQAVLMDGSSGANCTVTDVNIGFVSSTGFASGHAADSVVKIASNCNAIKVGQVSHRAVNAGFVDATQAVVLVTNNGGYGSTFVSARYGIHIGPVVNGSTTITAQAVVTSDGSSGAAAKMTGIVIEAGSQVDGTPPGGADIQLNYTSGAIVLGMPMGSSTNTARKVTVNATCVDTQLYGVTPSQVNDGGTNTLINGKNFGAIGAVAFTSWPFTYVNNTDVEQEFVCQGAGSITTANYTRGSTTVALAVGGTQGSWRVSPGDNIAINGTGTPTLHVIPR